MSITFPSMFPPSNWVGNAQVFVDDVGGVVAVGRIGEQVFLMLPNWAGASVGTDVYMLTPLTSNEPGAFPPDVGGPGWRPPFYFQCNGIGMQSKVLHELERLGLHPTGHAAAIAQFEAALLFRLRAEWNSLSKR